MNRTLLLAFLRLLIAFSSFTLVVALAKAESIDSILFQGTKRIESAPKTVVTEYNNRLEDLKSDPSASHKEIAAIHYILSQAFYSRIFAQQAVEQANFALQLLENDKQSLIYNKVLIAASLAYELAGQAKTAKPMAEKALAWAVFNNNKLLQQEALVAAGLNDLTLGAYDAALESFNKAYFLSETPSGQVKSAADQPELMAQGHIAYHIALVHEYDGNQLAAIKFFEQSKQYYKSNQETLSYSDALYGLARANKFNGNGEEALKLFEESLGISIELNDIQGQAYTYKELSGLYLELALFEKAHLSLVKALQYFSQSNNPYMLSEVNKQLAEFARSQNQILHASKLVDIALEYANGDSLRPHFIQLHKLKSLLQADSDDYESAYKSLVISYDEKIKYDGIINKETYERLRAEFSLAEKENENRVLAAKNLQANMNLTAQHHHKMLLSLLAVLLFTIAAAALFLYRQSKTAQTQLALLANTDSLTKLANRRTAFNSLALQIKLAKRERYDLSIALIDLDHFKNINDQLGHPVGDKVLQIFASLATEQFRSSDIIARIGGEEFLFIFPFTNIEKAQALIIDFTDNVKETKVLSKLIGKQLTCSVGVVSAIDYEDEISAITAADRLMYKAKDIGRDAIISEALGPHSQFY